jgi:hypothetical protein
MSWVAVDTTLMDAPEWRALSNDAKLLWLAGRTLAGAVESDGFIEDAALPLLMYRARPKAMDSCIAELVNNAWWRKVSGGWRDARFLSDGNASHEKRLKKKQLAAERKRRWEERKNRRNASQNASQNGSPERVLERSSERRIEVEEEIKEEVENSFSSTPSSLSTKNGFEQLQITRERTAIIREAFEEAIDRSPLPRDTVKQRWRYIVDDVLPELVARRDISESLVKRRAADFFTHIEWSRLGDSAQGRHLREHMLRRVNSHSAVQSA